MIELCRSVGFTPTLYRGTVDSILASVDLVVAGRCVLCAPSSCVPTVAGMVWRPLVDPPSRYPWSLLWRAGESSEHVRALVDCARDLSRRLAGWNRPHPSRTDSDPGWLLAKPISRARIGPFPRSMNTVT